VFVGIQKYRYRHIGLGEGYASSSEVVVDVTLALVVIHPATMRQDSVAVIDGDVGMSNFTQRLTDDIKSSVAANESHYLVYMQRDQATYQYNHMPSYSGSVHSVDKHCLRYSVCVTL